MSQFLEAAMVVCFGISWPLSIIKSYRARTSQGKSIVFLMFILVGYACGIGAKLYSGTITYVFIFYIINMVMVSADALLYFHNCHLDRISEKSNNPESGLIL